MRSAPISNPFVLFEKVFRSYKSLYKESISMFNGMDRSLEMHLPESD